MKVIKNYKPLQPKNSKEYLPVKILTDEDIFFDLPICAGDFGVNYEKPVLYGDYKGIPTVYEEKDVLRALSNLKLFHLKEIAGQIKEVSSSEADVHIRLPKNTLVKDLVIKDGQVLLAKQNQEEK